MTAQRLYAIWAAVGPLVGVVIGGLLTARWQRRKWILDNKTAEYRGILDLLNAYRWRLLNYQAKYSTGIIAQDAKVSYDDNISLAESQVSLNNALADRLFIRRAVESSGVREDFAKFSRSLGSDNPPSISQTSQILSGMHSKLIHLAETDLGLG